MRDLANKMAELKFEAPLAQFEESDEWGPVDYQSTQVNNLKTVISDQLNLNNLKEINGDSAGFVLENDDESLLDNDNQMMMHDNNENAYDNKNNKNLSAAKMMVKTTNEILASATTETQLSNNVNNRDNVEFAEAFSGSLEDLVNTFDEKITKCFGNYEQSLEDLAPVQVRSQEEIMNECQMWWTITGNFGNILPIDWSKSYARQMHVPALNLGERPLQSLDDDIQDLSSEDEAVANDLDMHALILGGMHTDNEPMKTAEEVIKEIDDIMDETPSEDGHLENEAMEKAKEVLGTPLYEEKLRSLTISQLNELYMEMEILIRELSETLINELALRDELEYEKELKNTFISLLLAVQNRRRQFHVEKKKFKAQGKQSTGLDPKYLTTVIPYHLDSAPPDNQALQILIKILKAINDDSPTVPTLLTDYILKVLCPT